MSDQQPPQTADPTQQLQEKILEDYPRLGPDDTFQFACHPGVSCFNRCCGDVNIFLSPYDVLRLKTGLPGPWRTDLRGRRPPCLDSFHPPRLNSRLLPKSNFL